MGGACCLEQYFDWFFSALFLIPGLKTNCIENTIILSTFLISNFLNFLICILCSFSADIDECKVGEASCSDGTYCLNTAGSYKCEGGWM